MTREIHKLFDYLMKLIITSYGNDFLRYIGETRKIKEILKTEITTLSGKTYHMDFLCLLDDGNLLNIEFQYTATSLEKLNIIFNYNIASDLERDGTTDTIIINFRTSNTGYSKLEIGFSKSFHPKNIYLGDIDFEKILSNIKDKVKAKKKLNSFDELNLLIMGLIPKYTNKNPIYKQICEILKFAESFDEARFGLVKCILKKEIDNLAPEIKNRINQGEIELSPEEIAILDRVSLETIRESMSEGMEKGMEKIIIQLLKHETPEEISRKLEMPVHEIEEIQKSNKN